MGAIHNSIKLAKDLAWPLTIVSGLMLWGPVGFKTGLGLQPFIDTYPDFVGVVFLFFLFVVLQPIAPFTRKIITDCIRKRKRQKEAARVALAAEEESKRQAKEVEEKAKNDIKNLTAGEKSVLRHFLDNGTRSQDLDAQNGDVARLESLGFIYKAFSVSYGGIQGSFTFPYNISDWSWYYIQKHPEAVD